MENTATENSLQSQVDSLSVRLIAAQAQRDRALRDVKRLEGEGADLRSRTDLLDDDDVHRFSAELIPWARAVQTLGVSDGDRVEALARLVHADPRRGATEVAMFLYDLADKLGRSRT